MSPTVFREGQFRFYFFSLEESRIHIHVQTPNGEAKFWVEPAVELAVSHGLNRRELAKIEDLVKAKRDVIRTAWKEHFRT